MSATVIEEQDTSKNFQILAIAKSTEATDKVIRSNCAPSNVTWIPYRDFWLAVRIVNEVDACSIEALKEYGAVVQELHELVDIIPMRFGTVMRGSQIPIHVDQRYEQLLHAMIRVAGCSELLIRWKIPEDAQVTTSAPPEVVSNGEKVSTGSEYLRKKYLISMQNRMHESLAAEAKATIESLLADSVEGVLARIMDVGQPPANGSNLAHQPILAIDLLVKKDRFRDVYEAAKDIALFESTPVSIRGPLPIYSFA